MLFPQSFIDDLRLQANIVQVVQDYVPLRKAGATYKGLCPFHSEKTPSFHVNPEKGFFHCFGCGVGGDVFKFLELHEKVGFQDAVRMLAQRFGVALPELVAGGGEDTQGDARLREAFLKMHEIATAYFRDQLAGPAGARAREHLSRRGLTAETIDRLAFGFAPPAREGLKGRLLGQGFHRDLVVQSGLVVQRDSGELVDRFRNRLMVPISRDTGSVIAFGGRAMEADQVPKYLNSPETPIYSKSRTLYGLHLAKAPIRKLGYVVLVEGYFDFAQVYQSQVAPVVATCGTALTPQQAQILRRHTSKVILSYDPDPAGQGAAARSSDLLVTEGFDVNVVVLDRGLDPDTFIQERGVEPYRERLRTSRPYLEYLIEQAASGLDFGHDEQRRTFLNRMLTVAARIPDAAARDQFADRLAHRAQITEEVVRAEIRKAAVGRRTTAPVASTNLAGTLKPAERALIWGLFHRTGETLAALEALELADYIQLAGRAIFEAALSLRDRPSQAVPSELLRRLSTMDAQLVTGIAGQAAAPATGLDECARSLKRLRWERERAAIQREIDRLQDQGSARDGDRIDLLLNQKHSLSLRIKELT
jgi:DNA primase